MESEAYRDFYGLPLTDDSIELYNDWLYNKHITSAETYISRWGHLLDGPHKLSSTVTRDNFTVDLIRQGVPLKLRGAVWSILTGSKEKVTKTCVGQYQKLVEEHQGKTSEAIFQIEKDVPRTFPSLNDKLLENSIRRVLVAYSWYNPQVGYAQAMNFIVGCLLFFMDDEHAFWTLDFIINNILKQYFEVREGGLCMVGSLVDGQIVDRLVKAELPELYRHCRKLGFTVSVVFVPAFITMLYTHLPRETTFRIWDCIFLEGPQVLHQVALNLLSLFQRSLMKCQDEMSFVKKFISLSSKLFDADILLTPKASLRFATLSATWIINQREKHRPKIEQKLIYQNNEAVCISFARNFTQFTVVEIRNIFKQFLKLCASESNKVDIEDEKFPRMNLQTFLKVLSKLNKDWPDDNGPGTEFLTRLFRAMDESGDNKLSFFEFICGLNVVFRGDVHQKAMLCFKVFDSKRTGLVSKAEFRGNLQLLYNLCGLTSNEVEEEIDVFIELIYSKCAKTFSWYLTLPEFYEAVFIQPVIQRCFLMLEPTKMVPINLI